MCALSISHPTWGLGPNLKPFATEKPTSSSRDETVSALESGMHHEWASATLRGREGRNHSTEYPSIPATVWPLWCYNLVRIHRCRWPTHAHGFCLFRTNVAGMKRQDGRQRTCTPQEMISNFRIQLFVRFFQVFKSLSYASCQPTNPTRIGASGNIKKEV